MHHTTVSNFFVFALFLLGPRKMAPNTLQKVTKGGPIGLLLNLTL